LTFKFLFINLVLVKLFTFTPLKRRREKGKEIKGKRTKKRNINWVGKKK